MNGASVFEENRRFSIFEKICQIFFRGNSFAREGPRHPLPGYRRNEILFHYMKRLFARLFHVKHTLMNA